MLTKKPNVSFKKVIAKANLAGPHSPWLKNEPEGIKFVKTEINIIC